MVNRLNSPLNPGRPFVAVLIMLVAGDGIFLHQYICFSQVPPRQSGDKSNSCIPDLCFITANVMKKPDYIIGNKAPLQTAAGEEDLIVLLAPG